MRIVTRRRSTLAHELPSEREGLPETDKLGLAGFVKTAQQLALQPEFHVADSERAHAERSLADGDAIRLGRESLDARRRYGVGVDRHLEAARRLEFLGREYLHARSCGDESDISLGQRRSPAGLGAAVGNPETLAEALLELRRLLRHHCSLVVAHQRDLRAGFGGNHTNDTAHHSLGAEGRDFRALEPAASLAKLLLCDRLHGCGGGKGA